MIWIPSAAVAVIVAVAVDFTVVGVVGFQLKNAPITIRFSLPKSVFVIVHPNLQNPSVHPNLMAELLHQFLVPLLHLPPHSLRELVHLILLILCELGPEPLPRIRARRPQSVRGSSRALRMDR